MGDKAPAAAAPAAAAVAAQPPEFHLLLAATGSVASIKVAEIARRVSAPDFLGGGRRLVLRIVCTKAAQHFLSVPELRSICAVYVDEDEWTTWSSMGDSVLHIELRKWAHALVVAPLDANTLAKLAHGLSDNLLTCVARAWDFSRPFVVCPAMNTFMWEHPFTAQQLGALESLGVQQIPPISKKLACGDTGCGALAHVTDIVSRIRALALAPPDAPRKPGMLSATADVSTHRAPFP